MSLSTVKLSQTIRNQYIFKLKSNIGLFSSLIILQALAMLFSLGGAGMSGGSFYTISYYTADYMIVFTMIWAFIVAIQLMTKDYRNHDFTFVTNRLGSSVANVLFLLTASIIGAITSLLSGYLLKVIVYYSFKRGFLNSAFSPPLKELIFGFIATILFIFIISLVGYLVGTIVQVNRAFVILLPVLFLGTLFMAAQSGQDNLLIMIGEFYLQEFTFGLFLIKMVMTGLLLWISVRLLSNRLEVKQ